MNLSDKALEELKNTLTVEEPLGPSNAEGLIERPNAAASLFQTQNAIYQDLMKKSGILVGRRGSGKTAFLNQLRTSGKYRVIIFMNAPDVIPEVFGSLKHIFESDDPPAELVAKLWDILIWTCVFWELAARHSGSDARLQAIQDFLDQLGVSPEDKAEMIVQRTLDTLRNLVADRHREIRTPLALTNLLKFKGISFSNCLEIVRHILLGWKEDSKSPVLVLMDTLEEYQIDREESKSGVRGLLRYLGLQSISQDTIDIRFCLPAELYYEFRQLSSNVEKDFYTQTFLHWPSHDLLRIVTQRILLYAQVHDPSLLRRVSSAGMGERSNPYEFFKGLFPDHVLEESGFPESPIIYILRHTQLLPRQTIQIFNKIISAAIDGRSMQVGRITPGMVTRSVRECQTLICVGVSQAYKHRYPVLEWICREAIPELDLRFMDGDLQKVFNRRVKGAIKRAKSDGMDIDIDYHQFKRMLIEVGAIGREVETTEVFHEAEFEYAIRGRITEALTDGLCLHPLFSGTYPKRSNGTKKKRVYPTGCVSIFREIDS